MTNYIKQPFISITDFTHPEQVRTIYDSDVARWCTHVLGVGVMTSFKVWNGQPSKWHRAFPHPRDISSIFSNGVPSYSRNHVFNVLHYVDYANMATGSDLHEAIVASGPDIDAVQLDMVWPEVAKIERMCYPYAHKWYRTPVEVILQVGANAMTECGDRPDEVVRRLCEYHKAEVLDYVLLDRSMGRGKPLDAAILEPYIDAIKTEFDDYIGIVIAGGLGPDTLHLIDPLIDKYGSFSIDAQSRLRPSHSALDPVDWSMAYNYYKRASLKFL